MTARSRFSYCSRASTAGLLLTCSGIAFAQSAPIVQPGAPGQDGRTLTAEQASELAGTSYSPADVSFMQGMIAHHQQAVEMSVLARDRTNREEILAIAGRIEASQADEIEFMEGWLTDRKEATGMTGPHAHHAHMMMAGMATPDQMTALAAAEGVDFDRQFLTLMIAHHEGAIDMVEELLGQPGSAADPILFDFVGEIENDQQSEIDRMDALLASLSSDPRATLAAGFDNAGQAILNLRKVVSLPKPAGFFDPANPADLRPAIPEDEEKQVETEAETNPEAPEDESPLSEEESLTQFAERSPLLDFANTDMAFFDDIMVAGSYHGFNIYRLGEDGVPDLLSSVVCPGGQGDVSVVGDILVMSVEQTRGRVDCGLQGVPDDVSDERFRGLRVFDISDLTRPRQVGQVQTCRGSHTHSI
ncbi:MAG: DUF305 domain-containing protein, partial [Pseudomonadota bacterium]